MTKPGAPHHRDDPPTAPVLRRCQRRAALLVCAWACSVGTVAATTQTLAQGWRFRLAPGSAAVKMHPDAAAWRDARVPGSVQTDLLAAGIIGDPFYRDNETRLQWIGLADWQYSCR